MSISRSFHILSIIKRSQGERKKRGGGGSMIMGVWDKLENIVLIKLAIVRCGIK